MLNLIWEPEAKIQLDEIVDYIKPLSERGATKITNLILDGLNRARRFPNSGRPGRVTGTREIIAHPNYIIVYQVTSDAIDVLRILHARQRYP